jgi:cytochrome c oxidase cbb3-type subunit 3
MNNPPDRDPLLLDHDYDGIQELDNKLPRWWVLMFYITIFFGLGYFVYYHVIDVGRLMETEYQAEMKRADAVKGAAVAAFEATVDTLKPATDTMTLEKGKAVFTQMCAPCHRQDGGGLVGPNLCDDYWIHGSEFKDNLRTILDGVPSKGMVTWKGVLKPNEILAVASHIYTLRGTKPPNPKPPENQAPAPTTSVYE